MTLAVTAIDNATMMIVGWMTMSSTVLSAFFI